MIRKAIIPIIPAAALLLLAACTQDEPGGQGNELPYGEYPLQIGGVTLDVESSAEPWSAKAPQTRVTEDNTDGMSSVWEWDGSETIRVQLGDETADYTLNAGSSLALDRQLYWTSTAPATVTAWYPTDETIDLSDQTNGLAYVLKAEVPGATYDNEIALDFKHQLAKVRVVLNGTQASLAQSVEVYGYTTCTNNEGTPIAGSTQDWIKMKHTTYADGTECWEANVVSGNITLDNFVRINGQTAKINEGFPATLASGNMYTIDLTVGKEITDINKDNTTISDNGYYRVSGIFDQPISITGGNPTIYLENANINVGSGNAISVTGNARPTIHVLGENSVTSSNGAGIYVAQGSTVTITGRDRNDVLTSTGGAGSAGIGSYSTSDGTNYSCGNIIISNVTLTARSEGSVGAGDYAAGIGSAGVGTVGSVSISDATIYAQGYGDNYNMGAAAIGGGVDGSSSNIQTAFDITISNSTIHATRGCSQASYIGAGGLNGVKPAGYNIISTAQITDSHVYDESGNEITQ